jgi:hypothetical protein
MEPAEQNAVVGVGRTAPRGLVDVMDLAPRGRHVAPGDDAPAVAKGDRLALVRREHAVGDADREDAPTLAHGDTLHGTRTGDLMGHRERDRLCAPVDVRVPAPGREVIGARLDHECRCRPADRGQFARPRGSAEDRREGVVSLLHRRASVGDFRQRPAVVGRVDEARAGGRIDLGVEDAVEESLELPGDLGEELAAERNQPVAADAQSHSAPTQGARLTGLRAVLVEVHRPYRSLVAQIIGRGCGTAARALSARGGGELFVGRESRGLGTGRGVEGADHAAERIDPERTGACGFAQTGIAGGQDLTRGWCDRPLDASRGADGLGDRLGCEKRGALNEFGERAAPARRRHPLVDRRSLRAQIGLGDRVDQDRLGKSLEVRRPSHHVEDRVVVEGVRADSPDERGNGPTEHILRVGEGLDERLHNSILPSATDIRGPKSTRSTS